MPQRPASTVGVGIKSAPEPIGSNLLHVFANVLLFENLQKSSVIPVRKFVEPPYEKDRRLSILFILAYPLEGGWETPRVTIVSENLVPSFFFFPHDRSVCTEPTQTADVGNIQQGRPLLVPFLPCLSGVVIRNVSKDTNKRAKSIHLKGYLLKDLCHYFLTVVSENLVPSLSSPCPPSSTSVILSRPTRPLHYLLRFRYHE